MPEVFTIVPAAARPLWFLAAIGALLLAMLLFFGYVTYSSRATRFEISEAGLAVRGTLYGRSVSWSSLRLDEARVADLGRDPGLQLRSRTNGVGLPGYRAGWFGMRSGGRALLFVTDPSRVVVLPTGEGFTLLLSVQDPDAFLRALRTRTATSRI